MSLEAGSVSSTFPVVFLPSSARCASAASGSGNSTPTLTFNAPFRIHSKRSPARQFTSMFNGLDQFKAALSDLLGAPRDEGLEKLNVRRLTGIREAYLLATGDDGFIGGYYPEFALVTANVLTN